MSNKKVFTPPNDLDAERALLGAMLLRPVGIYDVMDVISPDSFYHEKHRTLWSAMQELTHQSEPIDAVSVSSLLRKQKKLKGIGGSAYLSELSASCPASTNAEHYARIVAEKYALRNLLDAGSFLQKLGQEDGRDIFEVLDEAEKKIFRVTDGSMQSRKWLGMKDLMPIAWESIEKMTHGEYALRGVPTGFASLDKMISGFQKSDLIVVGARPSMGKTSLALDFARRTALEHNVAVGFFSVEMSAEQLSHRLLSAHAQVDAWRMKTGAGLTNDDLSRIHHAMEELSKAPIYIDDNPTITVLQMRATARRLKREHDLGLIVVDYLQLVTPVKSVDSMVTQITEISRGLKSLARELEVPVLALSQLSREVEKRGGRPRLSDLRESGAIEQDADLIMFIHRDGKYHQETDPGLAEIMIEKHRNGATGSVQLYFDERRTTFNEIDSHHSSDPVAEGKTIGQSIDDEF